jgi:CheY-like chemotaxis protein
MNILMESRAGPGHALSVLVVDDLEANRAVIARRLEKLGYTVTCVDSGAAALAMLRQWQPDMLLLDYMMPQMNGIEVLRELRAQPATRTLPIIMVTARAESEAIVEALAAGADDYVTKPIEFEVLKARIDTQLAKRTDAAHLQRTNLALDERMTLRSMVLADLECELKDEIRRRQELERKLAAAPPLASRTIEPEPRLVEAALATTIAVIAQRFEVVFADAMAGQAVNLAQLAELRALLSQASADVAPGAGASV